MTETPRLETHGRLFSRYLGRLIAVPVVLVPLAALLKLVTTWEFAIFFCCFGCVVAWLGMSHSYARQCASAEFDPQSSPSSALKWAPWVTAAIVAVTLLLAWERMPETGLVSLSFAVVGLGLVFALFRGSSATRHAGAIEHPGS